MEPHEFSGIPDGRRDHPGNQAHPFKLMRVVEEGQGGQGGRHEEKLSGR